MTVASPALAAYDAENRCCPNSDTTVSGKTTGCVFPSSSSIIPEAVLVAVPSGTAVTIL